MKVFVLSLPGQHKRKEVMTEQLERLGLAVEFVEAVDGRNGLPDSYEPLIDRDALQRLPKVLTSPEIACALSHALVCKRIVTEGLAGAIILEDDAILSKDFASLLSTVNLCETGHDLILLYHENTRVLRYWKRPLYKHFLLRKPIQNPWGAVAYFITAKGASEVVSRSIPISHVADWGFDITTINAVCIDPIIVNHPCTEEDESHIGDRDLDFAKLRQPSLLSKVLSKKYRRYFYMKIQSEYIRKPGAR